MTEKLLYGKKSEMKVQVPSARELLRAQPDVALVDVE